MQNPMRTDTGSSAKQEVAYVFDSARLLPGDIVLSTVPTHLLARIICAATWSDFSHAAICSKPGLLVEARGFGVARIAVGRVAVRELSNVQVLRLRSELCPAATTIAAKAGEYAEEAVLSKYSYWGFATALLKWLPVETRYEFFCSHLVAEAYRTAGLELLPGLPPAKTVPGAIAKSLHLTDITASVTRLEVHHPFTAWEAIDVGRSPSVHQAEVAISHRIVGRMKKDFKRCGVAPPETFSQLIVSFCELPKDRRKAMDEALAQTLQEEGYLELIQRFSEKYSASYYYDQLVQFGLETKQITAKQAPFLLSRWRSLLEGYRQEIEADRLMAKVSRRAYEATELQTLDHLSELYAAVLHMRTQIISSLERSIRLLEGWDLATELLS